MIPALEKTSDAHITSPWDATALAARCADPEGDPTEVIPAFLLHRLLAETAQDGSAEGVVPRFEVVELEPDEVIVDDSAFENAFEEMLGGDARG
jgi:hypothetical protein